MSRLLKGDSEIRAVIAGDAPSVEAWWAGVPAEEYVPEPGSWLARLLGGESVRLRGHNLLEIVPDVDTNAFFQLTEGDELIELTPVVDGRRQIVGWERRT